MPQRGFGPAPAQPGHGLHLVRHELRRAHAARGARHQHRAEAAGLHAPFDRQPGAAVAVFARRHRFQRHEQIVQASAAGQAQLMRQRQQGLFAQPRLGRLAGQMLQKTLGADPGPTGEQALQARFRQMQRVGQLGQFRLALGIRHQIADGVADTTVVAVFFENFAVHGLLSIRSQRQHKQIGPQQRPDSCRLARYAPHIACSREY